MIPAAFFIVMLGVNSTAFSYREGHPAALFPYTRAVSENRLSERYISPAGLPGGPSFFLDMAYSQPYGLEGLHAGSAHGGVSSNRAGGMLSWSGFGIEEYREDTAEASAGIAPNGWFRAGAGLSFSRLLISTDEAAIEEKHFDLRLSAVVSPFPWIEAGFQQENARSLFNAEGEDLHFPAWSAGVALRPVRGFGASWNITSTFFGAVNTLSVSANLLECLLITGGYSRETNSIAGAVILVIRGMMISYGLRYHSYLGATHSLGATVTMGMAPPEEINYNSRIIHRAFPAPEVRTIDLKDCTVDELCEAPGMERPLAERLVKFRAIMGPLSRKAMIQMGATSGEFRIMEPHFKNLAPDDEAGKKFRDKFKKKTAAVKSALPFASNENRKALFRSLVSEGVKAGSALRITEIARNLGRNVLDKKIDGLTYLSADEKKAAHRACGAR